MKLQTHQMDIWTGEFGRAYTDRMTFPDADALRKRYVARYGATREDLSREWLADVPRNARILEVGSNVGHQLRCLKEIGFHHLFGIEIQRYCVDKAKVLTPGVDIIEATGFDIPFKDGYFDLVFTNNVLIHIAPDDQPRIMDEMYRVTRRFIWGFEYYSPAVTEISYRGNSNLLWKADYAELFRQQFPNLKTTRENRYECRDEPGTVDKAYLLEK